MNSQFDFWQFNAGQSAQLRGWISAMSEEYPVPPGPVDEAAEEQLGNTDVNPVRLPSHSHRGFPALGLDTSGRFQVPEPHSGGYGDLIPYSAGAFESNPRAEPHFGGSAPVSPATQLAATLTEDDTQIEADSDADEEADPGRAKTAAERLAEKRRMKRFRLTHNQTRFLMSEFARQPHPDAAHRQRLSREIPGLSPRQVQVWFQNRRAKLKRLTTESDRDSIMQSRALPEDFDTTNILNPTPQLYPHQSTSISQAAYSRTPDPSFIPSGERRVESESPSMLRRFSRVGTLGDATSPASTASERLASDSAYTLDNLSTMSRARSQSLGIGQQRLTRLHEWDAGETSDTVASPPIHFSSNLDYSTLSPSMGASAGIPHAAEAGPATGVPSLTTTFAPGFNLRAPPRPFPFMMDASSYGYTYHESMHEGMPVSPTTVPPNPGPSSAGTSLPSTLLAFSRMHDQSAPGTYPGLEAHRQAGGQFTVPPSRYESDDSPSSRLPATTPTALGTSEAVYAASPSFTAVSPHHELYSAHVHPHTHTIYTPHQQAGSNSPPRDHSYGTVGSPAAYSFAASQWPSVAIGTAMPRPARPSGAAPTFAAPLSAGTKRRRDDTGVAAADGPAASEGRKRSRTMPSGPPPPPPPPPPPRRRESQR